MPRLIWDDIGERYYETGVRNGVLYVQNDSGDYPTGVVWNGLTGVTESPSGAEPSPIYADDIKYLNLYSAEEFGATVEAYTYPDEWAECDGSAPIANGLNGVMIGQQARKMFGLSYRTTLGNDTEGEEYGYKLHMIYGAKASPSEKAYATISDSPEAITFSWELTTTAIPVPGKKPTSIVTINSTKSDPVAMGILEAILYGVDAEEFEEDKAYKKGDYVTHTESTIAKTYIAKEDVTAGTWDATKWVEITNPGPRLPKPEEIISIFSSVSIG